MLLVVETLAPCGSTDLVRHLCTHLDRERFRPEVLALRAWGGDPSPQSRRREERGRELLRALGVPTAVLELDPQQALPRRLAGLARWLRQRRYHVVHAHSRPADLWSMLAASWAGVPVRLYSRQATYGGFRWATRVRYAGLARLASCVVAVSEAVREHLIERERVPPDRIETIRDAIDLAAVERAPSRSEARHRLGLPGSAPVIGCVARLVAHKGQHELVEAADRLLPRWPELRVLLVGDGPERRPLAERIAASGRPEAFRLLGERDDALACIAAMDVFVLPSRWEGLNLSLISACALGRAVVATHLRSNREIVEPGVSGLLPTPREPVTEAERVDVRALAVAIERLLTEPDLRGRLGERARERARARFDARRMAAAHAALYRRLLARQGGELSPRRVSASPSYAVARA